MEVIVESPDKKEPEEEETKTEEVSAVVGQKKAWEPNFYCNLNREIHYYAGHEIRIYESLDSYGAIIWPAGVALCQYLESNWRTINLQDKVVLELGAGTGLVSIVASLLGAWVTASDLPEVLGNLRCNLSRNTRGYCRYAPQVAALSWGYNLEQTFPRSVYRYDYVLAADVVYHHDFLDELLVTMRHVCQPGTTLIWANKIRFASDLMFTKNFEKTFNTMLLADLGEIKIYSATMKDEVEADNFFPEMLLEDAARQKKESECNFGNVSKKEDQHTDEDEVEDLNRESEQKIVKKTGEAKDNCDGQHTEGESHDLKRNTDQAVLQRSCLPSMKKQVKDVFNFLGHKISIENSSGDLTCPAAVALCKFLETSAGQEKIVLLDQTVLELHAGTGLVTVVATLLGAKVTATDQPGSLENLRSNLHQNIRGHLRHKPQVTALTQDLEQNFPRSKCHYDYVLAAEELHRYHDRFAELLVIMRHFCQPGTNLIWAIKMCYPSGLFYINAFNKAFHSTLLEEVDGVRIYSATHRGTDNGDDLVKTKGTEDEMENCPSARNFMEDENLTREKTQSSNDFGVDSSGIEGQAQKTVLHHQEVENEQEDDAGGTDSEWEESQFQSESESISTDESDEQLSCQKIWESKLFYFSNKEIHYFMGHRIIIEESFDSYGAMIWPAAVGLCKFLETEEGRQKIDLLDKTVLEIGAGTGLLSIVIILLGGKLTATDLPEILSNLRFNLNRNTRWLRRHEPQVKELSWGYELEKTFPHCLHHYDYVLAADVVYHHNFLDELLATMQHFCQRGTTLIWANKIRYPSDLTFLENFENIFQVTLLAELDEIRIYSATYKTSSKAKDELT